MRSFLFASALSLLALSACTDTPGEIANPPTLRITSPERSAIKEGATSVTVTGLVTPNVDSNAAITHVTVNDTEAVLGADGSFTALIQVKPGATMLHTEAKDAKGAVAEDTRTMLSGEVRSVGTNVEDAITVAVSKEAFGKLSAAAGPIIKNMDMAPMVTGMNPMAHWSDEDGADCNYAQMNVLDVNLGDAKISLTPTNAGLMFSAEIDNLEVPANANYSLVCIDGHNDIDIKATKVTVTGILVVTADGNKGFATTLTQQAVQVEGLDIQASGLPGDIINFLHLDTFAGYLIGKIAPSAMEPMLNKALGAMDGPQELNVLGKKLTVSVDPTDIHIDATGALITMSTQMLIEGSESGKYVFTPNGPANPAAGDGLAIGLADDLGNMMLAEAKSINLLNMTLPATGGSFDSTAMEMTLPPVLSADPADGKMKVILGDVMVTYANHGTPVGRAALNASIDLKIEPTASGNGVAIKLGTPVAHVDVLDDIANTTRLDSESLSRATEVCLGAQVDAISQLLTNVPLPALAGVQMHNLSLQSDDGYLMLNADIE
ncbi:MAG TPA: hypothetical protein VGM39_17005 [Kofleriaceae bacterium]|jgi:hypothetical protein